MTDQLNAGVLGCYGGPVPTPNLDRLAAESMVFENAICPTPFCSPSRASLITGLYPHKHGIVHNCMKLDYPVTAANCPDTEEGIKKDDLTTEKLLNESGYNTHHYGKWHLTDEELPYYTDMYREHLEYGKEMSPLFDKIRDKPREQWMNWYGWSLPVQTPEPLASIIQESKEELNKKHHDFITKMGILELPLADNYDMRVADRTIKRLEETDDSPFMITCSFNNPHDPNVVPRKYYDIFSDWDIELPGNFETRERRYENSWSSQIVKNLGINGTKEFLKIYYGQVKLVDDQVGRVLTALDNSGKRDDTIVIFTSDHGDMAGGHGMVWKSNDSFYEEVVRVPLIMRYPDKIKPVQSDLIFNLTDLKQTLLDLAGHKIPEHVQGNNLASYLLGVEDDNKEPDYTFSERVERNPDHLRKVRPGTPANLMIRGKRWKYIQYYDGEEFMYNLAEDAGETNNLINNAKYQQKKEELKQELCKWLHKTEYPL